jgi:hypothetical protein
MENSKERAEYTTRYRRFEKPSDRDVATNANDDFRQDRWVPDDGRWIPLQTTPMSHYSC